MFPNRCEVGVSYDSIEANQGSRRLSNEVKRWPIVELVAACPMFRARAGRNRVPGPKVVLSARNAPMPGSRAPSDLIACPMLGAGQFPLPVSQMASADFLSVGCVRGPPHGGLRVPAHFARK